MKSNQQKPSLTTCECEQRRLKQVFGHIVVERSLVVAHRIFVQPAPPLREWPVEKLLGLPAQSPPLNHRETTFELVLLAGNQGPVVVGAEHLPKRRDVPEQRARRLD